MEFEVFMTVTRIDSVKTYVHADGPENARRKVEDAMESATKKEIANAVTLLIIDGKETPVLHDDLVSEGFEVVDVTAIGK
jgi:hypothetical protein